MFVYVFRVTFRFRNSKKSNNGTDANAGQIPQLLYRLPGLTDCAPAVSVIGRKTDQSDTAVHVLSLDFSHSVSPVCIHSHNTLFFVTRPQRIVMSTVHLSACLLA